MDKIFLGRSLEQLQYWAHENQKTLDKIFDLLHDIERNGAAKGIGKPEPLKYRPGWSRRIDDANRHVSPPEQSSGLFRAGLFYCRFEFRTSALRICPL